LPVCVRYRRLLKTRLTELEQQYIEKRLSEEEAALDKLAASTFPLTFPAPRHQAPRPEPASVIGGLAARELPALHAVR
jgi:hypothetical protein